jgi:ubiquinone/menaquinone biosynthesis C-methylase UbiE
MAQLDALLATLALQPTDRVLDLGCGVGLIAEYIADRSGATVTGLDYMPEAIEEASRRTAAKRNRVNFYTGNLDHLPFPPASFDALVAIDTLYMPNDLDDTLAQMRTILRPGGQMGIFYSHMIWDEEASLEVLQIERTPLGEALARAGLAYTTQEFTEATYSHLQRKYKIAETLKANFIAEGHEFLYKYLVAESERSPLPYDSNTCRMRRYMLHVRP